jgi:5'-nucleotidase
MTKYKILVSNDDGAHSPLLVPFLQALSARPWQEQLRAVVPAQEQSWIAQAVTRYKPVFVTACPLNGHSAFFVEGTPADCVSLGIYNLYPDPPDLVFSGINLGVNTGLAFHLSSGTVGGARQAFLSGIRAAAFSVQVPGEILSAWVRNDLELLAKYSADWDRLALSCTSVAELLVEHAAWNYADLFSVNVPWTVCESTPIVLTKLERKYYQSMFRAREDGGYQHNFQGYNENAQADWNLAEEQCALEGDITALEKGLISVTPVRHNLGIVDQAHIQALGAMF